MQMAISLRHGVLSALTALFLSGPTSADTYYDIGLPIFVVSDGEVIATHNYNNAGFSNDLYLGDMFVFNNHSTPLGTSVSLGTFSTGTELIFRMHVTNTNSDYFTGDPARNPNGEGRARVLSDAGQTLVLFEDYTDFFFNDLTFYLTNVATSKPVPPEPPSPVPLPAAGGMMAGVLSALGVLRRRRAG